MKRAAVCRLRFFYLSNISPNSFSFFLSLFSLSLNIEKRLLPFVAAPSGRDARAITHSTRRPIKAVLLLLPYLVDDHPPSRHSSLCVAIPDLDQLLLPHFLSQVAISFPLFHSPSPIMDRKKNAHTVFVGRSLFFYNDGAGHRDWSIDWNLVQPKRMISKQGAIPAAAATQVRLLLTKQIFILGSRPNDQLDSHQLYESMDCVCDNMKVK